MYLGSDTAVQHFTLEAESTCYRTLQSVGRNEPLQDLHAFTPPPGAPAAGVKNLST
jgi:hypothetical protein